MRLLESDGVRGGLGFVLAAAYGQENRNQRSLLFEAVKNPNSSSMPIFAEL